MERNRIVRGVAALLAAVLLPAGPAGAQGMKGPMSPMEKMKPMERMSPMRDMGGMSMPRDAPTVPAVSGYSEGREILFIHTEASDPKIAKILTDMMGGSPVLVVPALAQSPPSLLAPVYVFTNGTAGTGATGPLGGQADVFPHPPGDPRYRPLRAVVLVTWKDAAAARVVTSVAELRALIDSGAVSIEESGVVVNMPFLTWPGGRR